MNTTSMIWSFKGSAAIFLEKLCARGAKSCETYVCDILRLPICRNHLAIVRIHTHAITCLQLIHWLTGKWLFVHFVLSQVLPNSEQFFLCRPKTRYKTMWLRPEKRATGAVSSQTGRLNRSRSQSLMAREGQKMFMNMQRHGETERLTGQTKGSHTH